MNPQDNNTAANDDTTSNTSGNDSGSSNESEPISTPLSNGVPQNSTYPTSTKSLPSNADNSEWFERSTIMAFGALFILPLLVILACILFFLPYIYNTLIDQPESGATTQTLPGKLPPTYSDK